MSTKFNYTRIDYFSLERSEIVKLDRDESRCNTTEASLNLEACYQAYTESKVCSLRGITICNKFWGVFSIQLQCKFPWWNNSYSEYKICQSKDDYSKYRRIHHRFFMEGEHELYNMTGCLPGTVPNIVDLQMILVKSPILKKL